MTKNWTSCALLKDSENLEKKKKPLHVHQCWKQLLNGCYFQARRRHCILIQNILQQKRHVLKSITSDCGRSMDAKPGLALVQTKHLAAYKIIYDKVGT